MKALIHETRVCQIEAEVFPVAAPLYWVDCSAEVTTGHTYEAGQFIPPRVPVEDLVARLRAQLRENDITVIRALVEGDAARIEAHKAKQAALRAQLAKGGG